MENRTYVCPNCGFNDLAGTYSVCRVCMWEEDLDGKIYPLIATGPNNSLYDEQQKIIKKYPLSIKKTIFFDKYENKNFMIMRSSSWKPIDIGDIKYKDKPFIEKWYYEDYIKSIYGDDYNHLFEEAQEYNPTDY
ncbi:hypothetical protein A9Q91_03515 [Candidatus Gracilibacteria bacterium 28_42_T64]|nr:hypothetical protein A9Q91_03515 [Candidatus Gracilibacteria bacterium 28_42_T64]